MLCMSSRERPDPYKKLEFLASSLDEVSSVHTTQGLWVCYEKALCADGGDLPVARFHEEANARLAHVCSATFPGLFSMFSSASLRCEHSGYTAHAEHLLRQRARYFFDAPAVTRTLGFGLPDRAEDFRLFNLAKARRFFARLEQIEAGASPLCWVCSGDEIWAKSGTARERIAVVYDRRNARALCLKRNLLPVIRQALEVMMELDPMSFPDLVTMQEVAREVAENEAVRRLLIDYHAEFEARATLEMYD